MRVADVIRRHAERRPEAVALRDGERELVYGDLDERSNRLAQALRGERRGGRHARRLPRPLVPRGDRAAVRGEQGRRGARAAELAAGAARAGRGGGGCASAGADRRPRVPRGRRGRAGASVAGAGPGRRGRGLRALARGPRAARSGRARPRRRRDRPDVHIRHDRRPEGRAHHASQPRRHRTDLAPLGVRRAIRQPHPPADVPHRRDRMGVLRAVARCHDHPRARLRAHGRARHPRAPACDQRGARADDAADADRRAGSRRARLLRSALDRLRRRPDHHAGTEGDAAHVRLRAARALRPDGDAPAAWSRSSRRITIPAARASTCFDPPAAPIHGSSCESPIRRTAGP